MEQKVKLDSVINKIQTDKNLKDQFSKDPVKTLEGLLGVNLPDEKLKPAVAFVKAKVDGLDLDDKADDLKDKLGDLLDKTDLDDKLMGAAKKLFGDKK